MGLSLYLRKRLPHFDLRLDLACARGQLTAIVGPSGAGKSTLIRLVAGLETPDWGHIHLGGQTFFDKAAGINVPARKRVVGMVFQDPDDQLFMPTVYDDVAFGPLNLGLPFDEVDARVHAALATVGGEHLAKRPPYRLSGGEKRAVAIATVLSMSPNILVLDEPTSNLDPRARRNLITLLHGFEHTKIIATHDLDMVMDLCGRTIVMHRGHILADGPTRDIFADDRLLDEGHLERPLSLG